MQKTLTARLLCATLATGMAFAAAHGGLSVTGSDQDVSAGAVTAGKIVAGENGWLVVHRTDDSGKPGPVVGHSPMKMGENNNVTAILTESVNKGEKMILMLHGAAGGMKTGVFEYTLGAKEEGPIKVDGKLVMAIVTAQ
ncbi:MAG: hypothetical protein QNK92_03485 [Amylibacter sp.]